MKTPIFISSAPHILPNWKQAFPHAVFYCGLPRQFDDFDDSLIFVDYMNLRSDDKRQWLDACLATGRKVFVLSPTPNLHEAIDVIKDGAIGYGHTLSAATLMQEMVLVVSHGGLWIGNKLLKRVMAALNQKGPSSQQKQNKGGVERFGGILSQREVAVGKLVATGATNAEISSALDIKERTVKSHITSLFDKLEVRNRVELSLLLNNIEISRPNSDIPSKLPAL
ncbi:DNA-binding response regulator, NarL/FixJ family, contains REC and HTH domains [Alteromonadaceae bacterium Bs31]|nr:DNA-binding response regulator, NarL/FixJ family, contains REC and HTH domains [Alteromonadaceae bacterium Bs31]